MPLTLLTALELLPRVRFIAARSNRSVLECSWRSKTDGASSCREPGVGEPVLWKQRSAGPDCVAAAHGGEAGRLLPFVGCVWLLDVSNVF